ncbi:MagT1 [Intoshia linei]|uniref:MagT1 n=1 Tax=Intoshia linei TaxID=1819745 RepID=A0A177B5G9_9BILA|nr:MagT1 [Intoshia linei]
MIAHLCFFVFAVTRVHSSLLDKKYGDMVRWSLNHGVISFDDTNFSFYVREKPINYSIIILLNAVERDCDICRRLNDEFIRLQTSAKGFGGENKSLFFGVLDVDNNAQKSFMDVNVDTAPVVIHISPDTGSKISDIDYVDFNTLGGYSAEHLAKWIYSRTGIKISIKKSPLFIITICTSGLLGLIVVFYLMRLIGYSFLFDKTIWAYGCCMFSLLMISGVMWNIIRKPPLLHNSENGLVFVHNSSNYQFLVESIVVATLCL